MATMKKYLFLFLLIPFLLSCEEEVPVISEEAERFLTEVLDIMEQNSLKRKEIDWPALRTEVTELVGAAQNTSDTYEGIRRALTRIDDKHSFFRTPFGSFISGENGLICQAPIVREPPLPDDIGYVRIRSFSGASNDSRAISFAEAIQNSIRDQDSSNIKGWIVDLRGNGGGNMWPMLAGVGPILGQGVAGHFIDPNNNVTAWGYDNGKAFINLFTNTQINNPYQLINPDPKVAVLQDKQLASSGEAIAIAFIGRENTRSFGTETCGLSTSNNSYSLSDNSTLFLTTSFMADRDRNTFGDSVPPDQEASPQNIIEDAISWIEN
ncbi:MAG: S41 family peptidase [Bacteroidia bacterium]|nr:S41 family peptidase [Bacteroidia bacterium]